MDFSFFKLYAQLFAAGFLHLLEIRAFGQSLRRVEYLAAADGRAPQTYVVGILQLGEVCLEAVFLKVVYLVVAAQGHVAG